MLPLRRLTRVVSLAHADKLVVAVIINRERRTAGGRGRRQAAATGRKALASIRGEGRITSRPEEPIDAHRVSHRVLVPDGRPPYGRNAVDELHLLQHSDIHHGFDACSPSSLQVKTMVVGRF